MIGIIDLKCCNIGSIISICEDYDEPYKVVNSPENLEGISKIILPGVGSFDSAMSAMKERNLENRIKHLSSEGVPILGICLGMQILCHDSEEGEMLGLGLIDARVKKFNKTDNYKVPHMGWNSVTILKDNPLFFSAENRFYFVHSYYVEPNDNEIIMGSTNYSCNFCSFFQKENIYGVQFHPEKSHKFGMELFKNFFQSC